jgi:hypothetical protein
MSIISGEKTCKRALHGMNACSSSAALYADIEFTP